MGTDAQPESTPEQFEDSTSIEITSGPDDVSQAGTSFKERAFPVGLAVARSVETAEQRRRAAENLPPFIAGQPEAVIRRWKYHAARSMRAGKPGKESGDKLDDMIKTYGPKWRRQQDSTTDQAMETDRAGQYAGLPDEAYALAVRCDLSLGEILHRDSLGMCLEPVEQLIADTAREFVKPSKEAKESRERFAAINAIVKEHYLNG